MPVQYQGIIPEHMAVRQHAGLFDVSHMGFVSIEGPKVRENLNRIFSRNLDRLSPGRAVYGFLLNQNGQCIDDVICYCEYFDRFSLVLNASNKDQDLAWIQESMELDSCRIEHAFDTCAILALQGPRSPDLLQRLSVELKKPFHHGDYLINQIPVKIAFTGYTGEKGCELIVKNEHAVTLWRLLLRTGADLGIQPCGLGARDTLRTEMGYPLYGQDLSLEINPVEAGLEWAIDFENHEFFGKNLLLQAQSQNPRRKWLGVLTGDRRAPRPGMTVLDRHSQPCGIVTSGTFSPSLERGIAITLVNSLAEGPFAVQIRDQVVAVESMERPPFYKKPHPKKETNL